METSEKNHTPQSLDQLIELLDLICSRPGMYVGRPDLSAVAHYVCGYTHALWLEHPSRASIWTDFSRWIQGTFLIRHPGWHWTQILLYQYGSDVEALQKVPLLFRAYLKEVGEIEDLNQWAEQRIFNARGTSCWAPDCQDSNIGVFESETLVGAPNLGVPPLGPSPHDHPSHG